MKSYMKQYGMRLAVVALAIVACSLGIIDPATVAMGGMILAYETTAGSTLACTTVVPASYDEGGYGASSMVYIAIGEITDLPGAAGRTYNTSEHAPLASRLRQRKKASYTLSDLVIQMAWDQSDAGQDLCRTAANDDSILTFKLTKQGGDIRYFTAQVSEFIENMGTIDNVVQGQMTLLRQRDTVSNPA
ncbi:MAG: hypothetical protein NUV34_03520 [Sulfuricaulis sp.]|nr:hypothetical protein [Sulfuricaulis sp.]